MNDIFYLEKNYDNHNSLEKHNSKYIYKETTIGYTFEQAINLRNSYCRNIEEYDTPKPFVKIFYLKYNKESEDEKENIYFSGIQFY